MNNYSFKQCDSKTIDYRIINSTTVIQKLNQIEIAAIQTDIV
jgi:hypothetical protein